MATVMISFLAGLFVGEGEIWKRSRTISILSDGSAYLRVTSGGFTVIATQGVQIVQDGPTLVLALDAHAAHPGPFNADELLPYRTARVPPCQREALNRRKIMRKARSKKKRPILLADLERRYRESPNF